MSWEERWKKLTPEQQRLVAEWLLETLMPLADAVAAAAESLERVMMKLSEQAGREQERGFCGKP